jgi:hypothetical protein
LLEGALRPADAFEELRILNTGCAFLPTKANHLLRLLGAKPKGLQLLLLRSSILRSLCGLDARLLRSLCGLHAPRFGHVNTLSASKFCGACGLNSCGFLRAETLCASQFSGLRLLTCKLGGAVLTKHLRCLLERLLRSLGLNTG